MLVMRDVIVINDSNDFFTPRWILDASRKVFGKRIDLDPCAHPRALVNAKRLVIWPEDGLKVEWKGCVFVNPPYSGGIHRWFHKAWVSHATGAQIIMLVPARTHTRYWHFYVPRSDAFALLRPISFIRDSTGNDDGSAPMPNALIYFGDNVQRFHRTFHKRAMCISRSSNGCWHW